MRYSLSHYVFFATLVWLATGCEPKTKAIDLEWVEGYWEIAFVTHGNETFYPKKGGLPVWDFYQLNTQKGFRKKGQPGIQGRFQTSDIQNPFEIKRSEKGYSFVFTTDLDRWEEHLIYVDSIQLILEHHDKKYHYQRKKLK